MRNALLGLGFLLFLIFVASLFSPPARCQVPGACRGQFCVVAQGCVHGCTCIGDITGGCFGVNAQ